MTSQYYLGPAYTPKFAWNYDGIIMSRDPVALDSIALDIIEKKRKEENFPSLAEMGCTPQYIATASDAKHRVGISDISKIRIM